MGFRIHKAREYNEKKEIILYNTHKSVFDVTNFCLRAFHQSRDNIFCNTSSKSNSVFLIQKIPGVAGDLFFN